MSVQEDERVKITLEAVMKKLQEAYALSKPQPKKPGKPVKHG